MSKDWATDLSGPLDELLAGWIEFVNGEPTMNSWRGRSHAQVATIMGLAAHVHNTAVLLRPAMPSDLTIVHVPLVRAIFEATITLVWCDEVADGAESLAREGARQQRGLIRALAGTRTLKDLADHISQVEWTEDQPASAAQGKFIEKRCADVALDGAYAIYRMLSALSHASTDTIDAYLVGDSPAPGVPLSVTTNPGPLSSSVAWSHLVGSCMVWAGMTVNYLDRNRARRSDLRRVGRQLGIDPELAVNYSAHRRGRPS